MKKSLPQLQQFSWTQVDSHGDHISITYNVLPSFNIVDLIWLDLGDWIHLTRSKAMCWAFCLANNIKSVVQEMGENLLLIFV